MKHSSLFPQVIVLCSQILLPLVHSFQGWHGFSTCFGYMHLCVCLGQTLVLAPHVLGLVTCSSFLQGLVLFAVPLHKFVARGLRQTLKALPSSASILVSLVHVLRNILFEVSSIQNVPSRESASSGNSCVCALIDISGQMRLEVRALSSQS